MLSDIIIGILAIALVFTNYYAFLLGTKYQPKEEKPVKTKIRASKKCKKVEESAEIRRLKAIMENIDNFDGTTVGQKEIK